MKNYKKVAVILPNYNYEKYLDARVNEIVNQTYPVSEIVFLDDGSTDGSVEKIQELSKNLQKSCPGVKVKTVLNEKNSGNVFSQWQKGVEVAEADYIWIAELDDKSAPNFLEKVMQRFENQEVVLSYTNSKYIGANGKMVIKDSLRKIKDRLRRKHAENDYIVDGVEELDRNLAVYNSIPNISAVVFKKMSELKRILNESKTYKLCGDWYFYVELARRGKIAYCSEALNSHRVHEDSVTGKINLQLRLMEMKRVHKHTMCAVKLSAQTKERMRQLEKQLRRKWGAK